MKTGTAVSVQSPPKLEAKIRATSCPCENAMWSLCKVFSVLLCGSFYQQSSCTSYPT